ncbi:MAG: ABC transporter permease [Actinomycetota bacterium]
MIGRLRVTPRGFAGPAVRFGVPFAALVVALLIGAILLAVSGSNPVEAYRTMFNASLNGWNPLTRTLALATPLILTGLAAAVAFQMRVYNIGGEGQLYLGAIAASWVGLSLPAGTPTVVMITAMVAFGALAGAAWALLAAIPKALFNADEIITTLMLNFVALSLMNYLIFGSQSFWRDPQRTVPGGKRLPESAIMPELSGRLHFGFIIAITCAVGLWWLLRRTTWGFQIRTIGDSPSSARYAGMSVRMKTIAVLAISGGLAAIAGVSEVSGVSKGLEPNSLATDIGFTGIIVAVVARSNPLGVVPVAAFLAAIATSGSRLQGIGIEVEVVFLLQGLIFLTVTAGEFFVTNKVELTAAEATEPSADAGADLAGAT